MSNTVAIVAGLVAAALFGISSVAQQRGTKQVKSERAGSPKILLDLMHRPVWLIGIGATVLGFVLQVFALNEGPLALVEPLLVCALVFATLISSYLARRWDLLIFTGVAACFLGIAGFLAIGRPKGGHSSVGFHVVFPLGLGLAVGVGACLLVAQRSRALRAPALALACGICFGVSAFLIKLLTGESGHGIAHLFTSWPIYALAVTGPLGFILNQNALQQSAMVSQVLSITTACDPIISIILAVVWLGETLTSTPLAIVGEVVALALMTMGIVIIAHRSPELAPQPAPVAAQARPG
jgi:drug/metabolite transporter (DMT)-like permease